MSVYYTVKDAFGYRTNEHLGTLVDGQLVLSLTKHGDLGDPEEALTRFTTVPDTLVIRDADGHHLSVGELRQSLRDSARERDKSRGPVVALPGHWVNYRPGINGLIPLDCEEAAERYLVRLFDLRPESKGRDLQLTFLKALPPQDGSRDARVVEFKAVYDGEMARYDCQVLMSMRKYGYYEWVAIDIELVSQSGETEIWRHIGRCYFDRLG